MILNRIKIENSVKVSQNAGTAGKIKINSTSKTKKIKAMEKKRKENGKRAENLGVNPHSKGLCFSESRASFIDNKLPTLNSKRQNIKTPKKKYGSKIQIVNLFLWCINIR